MLEERRPGDAPVVDTHHSGTGVPGELLGVPIPGRPAGGVRIAQNQHVFGDDRRSVRAGAADCIEPVGTDEAGLEPVLIEIAALHPADRQVDGVFRDVGGPFGQIGRTPVDVAEPHRLGV